MNTTWQKCRVWCTTMRCCFDITETYIWTQIDKNVEFGVSQYVVVSISTETHIWTQLDKNVEFGVLQCVIVSILTETHIWTQLDKNVEFGVLNNKGFWRKSWVQNRTQKWNAEKPIPSRIINIVRDESFSTLPYRVTPFPPSGINVGCTISATTPSIT